MAGTAKKKTTKSSRTTTKRSTRASGSRTSSARKAAPRSNTTRSSKGRAANTRGYGRKANEQEDEIIRRDVIVILLFALNIFLFLANFGILGPFGGFFRQLMFGLIGFPAYLFPVFIFACVLFYTANSDQPSIYEKIGAAAGLYLVWGIICELSCGDLKQMHGYSLSEIFTACAEARHGGGVFAGSIAYFLNTYLKMVGTVFVLLVAVIIFSVLISRRSLLNLLEGSAQNARERYRERKEELERYRLEHPEEFEDEEPDEIDDEEIYEEPVRTSKRMPQRRLEDDAAISNIRPMGDRNARMMPSASEEVQYRGIVGNTLLFEPEMNLRPEVPVQTVRGMQYMQNQFHAQPSAGAFGQIHRNEFGVKDDKELTQSEFEERLRTRRAVAEQDAIAAEFEKRRLDRIRASRNAGAVSTQEKAPENNADEIELSRSIEEMTVQMLEKAEEQHGETLHADNPLNNAEDSHDTTPEIKKETKIYRETSSKQVSDDLHEIHLSDFEDSLSIMYPEASSSNTSAFTSFKDNNDQTDYMSDSFSDLIIGQGIGMAIGAETAANTAVNILASEKTASTNVDSVIHAAANAVSANASKASSIVEDLHSLGDIQAMLEAAAKDADKTIISEKESTEPETASPEIDEEENFDPEDTVFLTSGNEEIVFTPDISLEPETNNFEEDLFENTDDDHEDESEQIIQEDEVIPEPEDFEESEGISEPDDIADPEDSETPDDTADPDAVEEAEETADHSEETKAQNEDLETVDVEIRRESSDSAEKRNESSLNTASLAEDAPEMPAKTVERREYVYPPLDLLTKGNPSSQSGSDEELRETAAKLQHTLKTFGVNVKITDISQGPAVTRYEMQPEQGVKVSKILGLSDDIKLALAATEIRIEAPIPGKSAVGIEVPNKITSMVALRDILETLDFRNHKSKLAFGVGKDISGQPVVADIAKMPHVLIAGATGSGKSVCINTIIMSILYHSSPEDIKMIMIDPKVVELSVYNGIPHLMIPVVTDPQKASAALNWAVAEMTSRFAKFADAHVRDLASYNAMARRKIEAGEDTQMRPIPQLIVIVDELADLMMVAKNDVETAICRLAQLARAAGIHLVIATQRPSVDVITGLIKANMPSRIAFAVTSGTDSRTILDRVGAEKLLGKGDMLFFPQNLPKPSRIQGAFVSDEDVSAVVDYICSNNSSHDSDPDLQRSLESLNGQGGVPGEAAAGGGSDYDDLIADAGRFIIEKNSASIGLLQRRFRIGFNRAARIMDQLCDLGVVGEAEGTKSRRILMTPAEFESFIEESL